MGIVCLGQLVSGIRILVTNNSKLTQFFSKHTKFMGMLICTIKLENFVWTTWFVIHLFNFTLTRKCKLIFKKIKQAERDHYSQYVTEDFSEYVNRKRQIGCFGNSLELQAIAEMFSRPVEVYSSRKGFFFFFYFLLFTKF